MGRNIIFDDLEIDHSEMMSNPQEFSTNVLIAAEKLKTILKGSNSIEHYIKSLPKVEFDPKDFDTILSAVYNVAYDAPIQHIEHMAKMLRKLAADVEYIAIAKATEELSRKLPATDKFTAHQQYMALREKYNMYVKTMRVLNIAELPELPPMPGNYGTPQLLVHYTFQFEGDDEVYRNYNVVCRKLGIESRNLMDTVDYCRKNPVGVKVMELRN